MSNERSLNAHPTRGVPRRPRRRYHPEEPPADRGNDRLRHILHHAAAVFADRGFHQAGMRDISEATGMSLAGLYYYFRSKDELLYLISTEAFETLLANLAGPLAAETNPAARLRIFVRQHLEYFLENKKEMKVISHEAGSLSRQFAPLVTSVKQRYYRALQNIVEELARSHNGGSPPAAPFVRVSTLALFGMMNWIYNWHRQDRDGDARYLADLMAGIFLGGLEAAGASTGRRSR